MGGLEREEASQAKCESSLEGGETRGSTLFNILLAIFDYTMTTVRNAHKEMLARHACITALLCLCFRDILWGYLSICVLLDSRLILKQTIAYFKVSVAMVPSGNYHEVRSPTEHCPCYKDLDAVWDQLPKQ